MKKPKDVDSYIAEAPKEARAKLKEMRTLIKQSAPDATEKISYGMPYYAYKGRLAYFSHWKTHVGLYIPTPVIKEHEEQHRQSDRAIPTRQEVAYDADQETGKSTSETKRGRQREEVNVRQTSVCRRSLLRLCEFTR
jgi:uncharacterized protein YdhG (YjbR/CyaY superfamily)